MMRMLQLRKKSSPATTKLAQEESLEPTLNDDDNSLTDSLGGDDSGDEPMYKSHAFQQRFHMDHPAGETMQGFSSFMQKTALSLPPPDVPPSCHQEQAPTAAPTPVWWSFDRDYDETKEENDDGDEESIEMDIDSSPSVSSPYLSAARGASETIFEDQEVTFEESKDSLDESFDYDGNDRQAPHDVAESFAPQQSLFMGDLGSKLASHHHLPIVEETVMEEAADEDCFGNALDFKPRFQDDDEDFDDIVMDDSADSDSSPFEQFGGDNEFTTFRQDAPIRPAPQRMNVEKCFDHIQFVSPEDFDTLEEATKKEKISEKKHVKEFKAEEEQLCPSLSNMVHPINLAYFNKADLKPKEADLSVSLASSLSSSSATQRSPASILHMDQYTLPEQDVKKESRFDNIRKKLSSSFRSKAGKGRVVYSLSKGKCGMTKKDLQYSKSLLPAKPLLSAKEKRDSSTRIPRSIPLLRDRPLSILLLNPVLKIFEIVLVDFLKDTTIGDALSKARSFATDEVLSEQKYVSLCNRKQELGAPMLPVSLLVGSRKAKKRKDMTPDEIDHVNRREMEARLLIAVPEGSTASDCRTIRRILWKNPKVQRWWKQSDPFARPADSLEDLNDEEQEIYANNVETVKRSRRTNSRKRIKYQKL